MEDVGYRRDEIKNLTRRYVQQVLFSVLRDESGNPKFLTRKTERGKVDVLAPLKLILFKRGLPAHMIDAEVAKHGH